ncbi:ATP-binding protein [Yersinia enterocolitica]|uniref:ATP-binding protein n=1 Tax=Yersinia enterocolitica TaxID=630 RepID=UPI001F5969A3|nr:ATP-binding protein [Yersinia enterocolitica]EKN3987780.1 ATP-binding protein [Yersinia enterocolitica]EKN4117252.1 ATP-binding protein [Yersinia enterocolitica]EKN4712540.1 ATP-binding protein [Yersinia enterocolitica]EKN5944415.1 ATP-binding protein [Yersinia enterocolitica]EKN6357071.1 ATP-binding protein [Yersinia enterocolitica]
MNTAQIRQLVVAAILGKTDAENRVYSPRDWPTTEEMYPVILVQTPIEEKQSLGRNAPQFNTITTVRITGRLQELDGENENDGANKAELALERLREQIERAVINSYDLTRQTQQFARVRSTIDLDSAGEGHLAQLLMELDIEYYQGPEDFYPIVGDPLLVIDITMAMPDGTTEPVVSIDLSE